MVADHMRGAPVAFGAVTAMARAACSCRRSALALSLRFTRSTRTLIADSGRCGWLLTLLGLLAKHHHPEPLEAERRLLQGKQQPKIPLEYLVQHAPIVGSQGIACEPSAYGFTVCAAKRDLFWSLHRGQHLFDRHPLVKR